jgi:hypothetical protein
MVSEKQVAVLRFNGPRFEDHGLDVDVLTEIVAYKRLLQEATKEIWRRKRPERERLPKGFDAGIILKFFTLQPGSTGVPLMRQFAATPAPQLMFDDELDEAACLLEHTIRAAEKGEVAPGDLPRSIIPFFGELGKSLRDDEFLLISAGTRVEAARYDRVVKKRILAWSTTLYTDVVDFTGEVRAIDLDGRKFTLRLEDDHKVMGRFKPEQEALVLEAMGEHLNTRIRVRGVAEFEPKDGSLTQIVDVERVELVGSTLGTVHKLSILERLALISAAVPEDAWKNVPTDLSKNIDNYLYGGGKRRD